MEDRHHIILGHHRPNIRLDLEPENILSNLAEILNDTDLGEIKAQSTREKRCDKLSEILPRKGRNAFKALVEALKEEAPHLASDLIAAEKGTEHELSHTRAQSAKRRGEILSLKTELEAEKQDHIKTSQELIELKNLHEISETETIEQIQELNKVIQQLRDASCSRCEVLRNERDSTIGEFQTLGKEIPELKKGITKAIKHYQPNTQTPQGWHRSLEEKHGNLSRDHKAVNKKQQEEIKDLHKKKKKLLEDLEKSKEGALKLKKEWQKSQRDLEKLKKDLACENERVKDYQQKFEEESKAKDDLLKQKLKNETHMSEENNSLREQLKEERSKSDNLRKEVHRLRLTTKEMPGQIFSYSKDFDKRGIVYALTTNSGKTSQVNASSTQIVVTRSSDGEGHAEDLLKNQVKPGAVSGTKDKEDSWWCVDLTEKYALYLTHYTLRHGRDRSMSVLLNWCLEGSLDGRKWITLKSHEDDHGLKEHRPYCTCTWVIDGNSNAFRFFRIFQTGKNSSGRFGIFLSGIELYGALIVKSS